MITRLYRCLTQQLDNIKLKNKLMLTYVIIILLTLGLFTLFSYKQVSTFIEGLVLYSSKQVFEQTNSFLAYKLGKITDSANIIAMDMNVNSMLSRNVDAYTLTDQLKDMEYLSSYLKSYEKGEDINRIKLYLNHDILYSEENANLFNLQDIEDSGWYRRLMAYSGNLLFFPASEMQEDNEKQEKTVAVVRKIKNLSDYDKVIGILRMNILENSIQSIIKKANTTKRGVAYLQNTAGLTVVSSNDALTGKWKIQPRLCSELSEKSDNWKEITLHKEKLLVGCRNVAGTDWFLVSVIPYEEIMSSSVKIRDQMFLLMVFMLVVSYILAYFISSSSTKRLSRLARRIKRVQNGHLDVIISSPNRDEIGELTEDFNYMVKKISVLIDEQYKTGLEVKNAELKALQAQINPHFLYNTLDLINWMAIKNKVPEISSLVKSLATFYQLSLSKGRDIVTIRDEISHAALYVEIQNRRFEDKIHFHVDVDEALYPYSILKIILQPIVENAILHGIMEKDDRSGEITVSGRLSEGTIILRVADNGVGMTQEKLLSVFQDSGGHSTHGYGVKNINDRLKLYYGEQYGLTFESVPGEGATVEIRLPAV